MSRKRAVERQPKKKTEVRTQWLSDCLPRCELSSLLQLVKLLSIHPHFHHSQIRKMLLFSSYSVIDMTDLPDPATILSLDIMPAFNATYGAELGRNFLIYYL